MKPIKTDSTDSYKGTHERKKMSKKTTVNVVAMILILVSTLITTLYFVQSTFFTSRDYNQNSKKNITVEMSEDLDINIVEEIKHIIIDLDEARNDRDFKKYASLFADSVERFYLETKVSNSEVEEHMRWYLSKKYPYSTAELNFDSISIDVLNGDSNTKGYRVTISGKHSRKPDETIEYFSVIKLNSDLKIFSIQDFIPSERVVDKL